MPRPNQVFDYRGYPMRSHSETRWAAMMDFLGISWLYEPKVYRTNSGGYLPDFYLPDAGIFIEVKGLAPSETEIQKARDLENMTGRPVVFAYGKPKRDGIYLINAFLEHYGGRHPVRYSLYEICQGIEAWQGDNVCGHFALAGRIQEEPPCTLIGELLSEIVDGWLGRQEVEKSRAATNSDLNRQKLVGETVPTLPTMCLLTFAEKAKEHRMKSHD